MKSEIELAEEYTLTFSRNAEGYPCVDEVAAKHWLAGHSAALTALQDKASAFSESEFTRWFDEWVSQWTLIASDGPARASIYNYMLIAVKYQHSQLIARVGIAEQVAIDNAKLWAQLEQLQQRAELAESDTQRTRTELAVARTKLTAAETKAEMQFCRADRAERAQIELQARVKELESELALAIKYLRAGKTEFSPKTTNSRVDKFLEKHSEDEK